MNSAEKMLIAGQRIARKNRYFGALSSGWEGVFSSGRLEEGVWKYGIVENDERNKEDRPVRDKGIDRAKVGCDGNEREAE
jgi:hypothetical protein